MASVLETVFLCAIRLMFKSKRTSAHLGLRRWLSGVICFLISPAFLVLAASDKNDNNKRKLIVDAENGVIIHGLLKEIFNMYAENDVINWTLVDAEPKSRSGSEPTELDKAVHRAMLSWKPLCTGPANFPDFLEYMVSLKDRAEEL